MKIGELVKFIGLVILCICFYEVSGLICLQCKVNGYCDYVVDIVWILELVIGVQGVGFFLEEIVCLLLSGDGVWQYGELFEGLCCKVVEIEVL